MDNDLENDLHEMLVLFNKIKSHVRHHDPKLYEQWKAGGFLVDDDVYSMYPNVSEVVNRFLGMDEDE